MYAQALSGSWWLWNGSSWSSTSDPLPSGPDTSAPSMPTNLKATAASSSQVNLTWNASSDNVGVSGYKIYRSGSQIATVTGTSYSNTGLSASTTYTYNVAAFDAAGNNSAQSGSANVLTLTGDGVSVNAGSGGTLLTTSGTWNFGSSTNSSGNQILVNGSPASTGFGTLLLVYNTGHLYAKTLSGSWWVWTGTGWGFVSADPRG